MSTEIVGYVMQISGDVTAKSGVESRDLSQHSAVYANDIIQTSANANIVIVLDNGNILKVGAGQLLVIDSSVYETEIAADAAQAQVADIQKVLDGNNEIVLENQPEAGDEQVNDSSIESGDFLQHTENLGFARAEYLPTENNPETIPDPETVASPINNEEVNVLDTTAGPLPLAITGISDDTGTAGDFITNDNTLVISGTVDLGDGNTLGVNFNGVDYTVGDGFLSVDGAGNWTLDVTGTTLADGDYTATVTATDTAGNVASATQNITVGQLVAQDDTNTINEDSTLNVDAASGVLANDSDPDGDTLEISAIRTGAEGGGGTAGSIGVALVGTYGTLTLNADGSYTYTADNANALAIGETAVDTFTYTVTDGNGNSDTAEISFTVTGINDAPVAVDEGPFAVDEDATITSTDTGTLLANDTDEQGGTLEITGFRAGTEAGYGVDGTVGTEFEGLYGYFTLNADGTYTYTANTDVAQTLAEGESVQESFTYTVSDGTSSDTATVTFNITGTNDAPIATLGVSDADLLGLVGAEATSLIDLRDKQVLSVFDVDNNIDSVTITSSSLVDLNLDLLSFNPPFSLSSTLAAELGLKITISTTSLLNLGIILDTYSITVTALDGGTIDNSVINELLGSFEYDTDLLNLTALGQTTLTVEDDIGATDSATFNELVEVGALGTADHTVIEDTAGTDSLTGTAAADFVFGLGGNDTINAGDGNDLVYGDAGDDVIHGDSGNDTIFGGSGNDTIYGDAGDDVIYAGDGIDTIYGGSGSDTIHAGIDDTVSGDSDLSATAADAGSTDTLIIEGSGTLDLSNVHHIEKIELSDGNVQEILNISAQDVFDISDTNELFISGGVNDHVSIDTATLTQGGTTTVDGHVYNQYTGLSGDGTAVTLNIEQTIYTDPS